MQGVNSDPEDLQNANESANSQENVIPSYQRSISESLRPLPESTIGDSVSTTLDAEKRERLIDEIDRLIEEVNTIAPDYTPPPFSPEKVIEFIKRYFQYFSPEVARAILEKLRSAIKEDLLDIDTWKGVWFMLNYFFTYQTGIFKQRMAGDYETDEWGYDPGFLRIVEPFMNFLFRVYWRVEVSGLENIPLDGRGLLVSNHSGQIPWDGAMLGTAIYNLHPNQRLLRNLYSEVFPRVPFVSMILVKLGQVLANEENGLRLLEQDQLVGVFPEGHKGISKVFKDRYRLARFGRGGFASMALKARAPIIPISIVGAEETYITLYQSPIMAKLLGMPFFPITLTWPWLGLLGFIPLPTKWYIDIGEPILTDEYPLDAASNQVLVPQISDLVRNVIQNMVFERLSRRQSIFLG